VNDRRHRPPLAIDERSTLDGKFAGPETANPGRRPRSKSEIREIENALEEWLTIQRMDSAAIAGALAQVSATAKADFTASTLKYWEARFKSGDKRALLTVLCFCLGIGVPIPDWLSGALLEACHSLPDSWDDVFGSPLPPSEKANRHAEPARRDKQIQELVYLRVREIGKPIYKAFEYVGNESGMSNDAVRTMYYEYRNSCLTTFRQHPFLREIVDLVKQHEGAGLRDGQIAKELQEMRDRLRQGPQRLRRRRRKSRPVRR
jgi:hypothetical protein